MDTRTIGLSINSSYADQYAAAKMARIPVPYIGDFLGDLAVRSIEQGKSGVDKFGAFLSSQAMGWRMHGSSRSGAEKVSRKSVSTVKVLFDDGEPSAIGSLPWRVTPLDVLLAKEGLALVDRLPDRQRQALMASMRGEKELPGVSKSNFRKLVQFARSELPKWGTD